jgi:hypothetical protein
MLSLPSFVRQLDNVQYKTQGWNMAYCSTVLYSPYTRPGLKYGLLFYCSLQPLYKTRVEIWTAILLYSITVIQGPGLDYGLLFYCSLQLLYKTRVGIYCRLLPYCSLQL